MLNVATFDVTELRLDECEMVQGGSDFWYSVGYYTHAALSATPYCEVIGEILKGLG